MDALAPLVTRLVDDLRGRTDTVDEVAAEVRGWHAQAQSAGRTDRAYEDWREDWLHQVAVAWVLGCVFVRFCEDNELVEVPLISGPGRRRAIAGDHRAEFFAQHRTAGNRAWLLEVFGRYAELPGTRELFADTNPLWLLGPSDDGARMLLDEFWRVDAASGELVHDFTDAELDTRFLGDCYQELSEHAKKQFALLQTPEFVEEFILERTLDPAIREFGIEQAAMIDPTCGSGHFLLGAFERLLEAWRRHEPATPVRTLAERALQQVNGVDVNPFAVSVARFRLLVAALKAAGIRKLQDAPNFHLRVATGDSLIHGTRPDEMFATSAQTTALAQHRYPFEDGDFADELLTANQYQAVVGNPPYITVKDPALNRAYRERYDSCRGKYAASVPFTERFFDLATRGNGHAGYVGTITANSFMKREFGKDLIEKHLPRYDLTHVIDTSGAYIPGHGTPTVILLGRDQQPATSTVRAVLGIRGEPGRPDSPARGEVWSSIVNLVSRPGSENDYVSVVDLEREKFARHPWSLRGGAAPESMAQIEGVAGSRLLSGIESIGFGAITGEDGLFGEWPPSAPLRKGLPTEHIRGFVTGDVVRDWSIGDDMVALFPYDGSLYVDVPDAHLRLAWPVRTTLRAGLMFGKTKELRGLHWAEYTYASADRLLAGLSFTFAFVATHNHFVLDRGGKVFKQSAPVIKLPEDATEDEHLELVGLLNSSAACFWMKQVFQPKGGSGLGRGIQDEPWEGRYEFDGTKLKAFPIPAETPLPRARRLDELATELSASLPDAIAEEETPRPERLDAAAEQVDELRARMGALQEELDWECYQHYGLLEEDLTLPEEQLPALNRGERAFEIVLARRQVRGEATTSWFERHGSTPISELPAHWPEAYRLLVERRIELIEDDRKLNLLERPEYKRRWNWDDWGDLEQDALREWLLDRLEARHLWAWPSVRSTAALADLVRGDEDFAVVAQRYAGRSDVDLTKLVTRLVEDDAVPYLAAYRFTDSGLRKRAVWERVWALQREEDELDRRARLPEDDPDHLSSEQAEKEKAKLEIPVPPKYAKGDFRSATSWSLRGKLDVPKERFIAYPGTQVGADTTPVIGWAGWDHLQQAQALAEHYNAARDSGAEHDQLVPLLAGLHELVPWLRQWHNEYVPAYGQRLDDFFASFVDDEARGLGITTDELAAWRPPQSTRGRRRGSGQRETSR
ncbi:BREX-2 system adenine-specific DNA-methyltransferase PglX [Egibacter rhizosphaerae]|uniref:site-specific DNA-methyltransferase (adenine-specific) n=2 Tax=Egibacter rhizosphaerae TaxID=1670831 RepID=A0A411YKZ0_9ACTN|nr:BREX-2 system adenine-specific DNA-methyltransferase PglX [Egibacter rhizosphaerae]